MIIHQSSVIEILTTLYVGLCKFSRSEIITITMVEITGIAQTSIGEIRLSPGDPRYVKVTEEILTNPSEELKEFADDINMLNNEASRKKESWVDAERKRNAKLRKRRSLERKRRVAGER